MRMSNVSSASTPNAFGYRLELTPKRDKYADGVAERTVDVIAIKTNIAMLNLLAS